LCFGDDNHTAPRWGHTTPPCNPHTITEERKVLETKYRNYSQNQTITLGTLELTKQFFLDSNKAVSEFETALSQRQNEILNNLLWNFSVSDKKVKQIKYKSPYASLAKVGNSTNFHTLLPVRDSNPNRRYQKP
jgi:hypothetical protein